MTRWAAYVVFLALIVLIVLASLHGAGLTWCPDCDGT